MPYEELLGRVVTLAVLRVGPPGAFLASEPDTVLLPRAEVPEGAKAGDELEVFVYLDSEQRPVATLRRPAVVLGEVAFVKVTDVVPFGAFVDWGLEKELLVPGAEQTRTMAVGERHPVGLFVDDSGRLAGTMRVTELLREAGEAAVGQWLPGEAWRSEPGIGVFVILEKRHVGLLPESEPHELTRGAAARFRVARVLADGKLELSLRGLAHEELENDAEAILAALRRPGAPKVGDRSSPEQLRQLFGLSKKAFKRAVGRLLKERAVSIDVDGYLVLQRR